MSWRHGWALTLAIGLLGGCAQQPLVDGASTQLPERVELVDVPFFAQEDYQCGPAALATMLVQRGRAVTPEQLVEQVYIPQRKGSLQVEMVAAARASGTLVYPLRPSLKALLAEVAAGNPVLVLQNLAFDRWPQWHFAVVVGYDLAEQELVLRSGTTRRWTGSFRLFERSWAKGDRWAVVMVAPDHVPATAEETVWLRAASDLEQVGQVEAARTAYRTAGARWAGGLAWFALANSEYAAGDHAAAEDALRTSLSRDSAFAVGWFNLSQVMAERGCTAEAVKARICAVQLAPNDSRFTEPLPEPIGSGRPTCRAVPSCPSTGDHQKPRRSRRL
ncbi:PA2778 family cysteine peptidase [Stutzerimonas stutzeri]|uniref:PA2778 family cysteine peptidase n=1 Tax=Stutzerimonas sp. S1 TaxID=3030652 RepID=UPI0022241C04|nr:PA2778 family cysteine peptidase [Stutzerimonas sp. S1]MCW3148786.1 PA2778 family cysteine peptidase [Stutzerimonas sp. S1]